MARIRTLTMSGAALAIGLDALSGRLRPRRRAGFGRRTGRRLRRAAIGCGPAFVKAAQLMSTRIDLLPAAVCAELGALHDRVPPIAPGELTALLRAGLAAEPEAVFASFDTEPVGSGSIACVYRAALADGTPVAVKIRRPGLPRRLAADLRVINRATRWAARLPAFRGMPAVDIVGRISQEIGAQADFARERESAVELARNLAGLDGVAVARPVDGAEHGLDTRALAERGILILHLVDVRGAAPTALAPEAARRAAAAALHAAYAMIFVDGFVHCDLHPGNLYFSPEGTVTLVDAGFAHRMSDRSRRTFAEFFFRMGTGNAAKCAEILLTTVEVPDTLDLAGFRADIAALVRANVGLRSRDFSLLEFSKELFEIQRRHALFANPEFVFPLLALLAMETSVKTAWPDTDFQEEAMPYLINVLFGRDLVPAAA